MLLCPRKLYSVRWPSLNSEVVILSHSLLGFPFASQPNRIDSELFLQVVHPPLHIFSI